MNLENETKESPLEKAKRLKAEKESKDQTKAEDEAKKQAEIQVRTEKLGVLNNSKQDLESKLNEINSKLEASRNEAHETRDTMKEGGLDKDEEFKDEYDSTISEVAGNLNELRNERNDIKAELERVNSNIENFDINEAISEGKEATQEAAESVKQENEEAITQVESYPGAEAGDIKTAEKITTETSKEVDKVTENSEKSVNEVTGETKIEENKNEVKKEVAEVKSEKDIQEILDSIDQPGTYGFNQEKLEQAFELAKQSPELKKALESRVESSLSEEVRLTPMMQGKNPTKLIENYSKLVSKDVIENAIANGLEGMTTYSGKTINSLSESIIDTKNTIGLSKEDTVRLLNKGLDSLVTKINKLQDERAKDLANEKTPDWKKESLKEEMKSAESFINQQKQRALEICKSL